MAFFLFCLFLAVVLSGIIENVDNSRKRHTDKLADESARKERKRVVRRAYKRARVG